MLKMIGWTLGTIGFLIVMGVAGSDCDGDCMENSLTMIQMLKYSAIGISCMGLGIYLGVKYD